MNKSRRKELENIKSKLSDYLTEMEELKGRLDEFNEEIECVRDEEESAYDNLPESIQEGERGEQMQAAIDAMDNAMDSVNEAVDAIDTAMNEVGNAFDSACEFLEEAIAC